MITTEYVYVLFHISQSRISSLLGRRQCTLRRQRKPYRNTYVTISNSISHYEYRAGAIRDHSRKISSHFSARPISIKLSTQAIRTHAAVREKVRLFPKPLFLCNNRVPMPSSSFLRCYICIVCFQMPPSRWPEQHKT